MPDAAKLVAATCLAIMGFLLSGLIMPVYVDAYGETNFGWFVQVNVVLGIVVGWISMGKRAGRGVSAAMTNGTGMTRPTASIRPKMQRNKGRALGIGDSLWPVFRGGLFSCA